MGAALAAARNRLLAWAERRLPALTRLRASETLPVQLDRRRIYVVPTRFGLGFSILLLVMLLGALNYGNNPALLLTCLLGATGGASVFAGFRAMSGLRLQQVRIAGVHAGDHAHLSLSFAADTRARASLRVRMGEVDTAFALPAHAAGSIELPYAPTRRGWHSCERLRLWTEYPLGLFHIWSWIHPDTRLLVLPALEIDPPALPGGSGEQGERNITGDAEELAGLRDYRSNDARRLIAWKASLRHDRLLVREVEFRAGEALALDYAALTGLDHEARIRRLAAWVAAADVAHRPFALRLPEEAIGPGSGPEHRRACMRALALLPQAEQP